MRAFFFGGGFAFLPAGGVSCLAVRFGWLRGGGDASESSLLDSESRNFAEVCAGRFFFCFAFAFGRGRGRAWMPYSFLHFEQARFLQVVKGASKMVQGGLAQMLHPSHLQVSPLENVWSAHTQTVALGPLHSAYATSLSLSCTAFAAAASFLLFWRRALQIELMQLSMGLMTCPQLSSWQRL